MTRKVYFHRGRKQAPNLASVTLKYPGIKCHHVEGSLEFTLLTMMYACRSIYWNLSNSSCSTWRSCSSQACGPHSEFQSWWLNSTQQIWNRPKSSPCQPLLLLRRDHTLRAVNCPRPFCWQKCRDGKTTLKKLGTNPGGSRPCKKSSMDAPKSQQAGRDWEPLRDCRAQQSDVQRALYQG